MIAPVYTAIYVGMKKIAEKWGYALALHGTMNRDLDLVAIPWTEEAESQDFLLQKFREKYDLLNNAGNPDRGLDRPHGRRAYVLMLEDGYYIDLSIMPKINTDEVKG